MKHQSVCCIYLVYNIRGINATVPRREGGQAVSRHSSRGPPVQNLNARDGVSGQGRTVHTLIDIVVLNSLNDLMSDLICSYSVRLQNLLSFLIHISYITLNKEKAVGTKVMH